MFVEIERLLLCVGSTEVLSVMIYLKCASIFIQRASVVFGKRCQFPISGKVLRKQNPFGMAVTKRSTICFLTKSSNDEPSWVRYNYKAHTNLYLWTFPNVLFLRKSEQRDHLTTVNQLLWAATRNENFFSSFFSTFSVLKKLKTSQEFLEMFSSSFHPSLTGQLCSLLFDRPSLFKIAYRKINFHGCYMLHQITLQRSVKNSLRKREKIHSALEPTK